jgi:hypothetical protein
MECDDMDPGLATLIDHRVLAVALRTLALARGGIAQGTGDALHAGLKASGGAAATDSAMPTCGTHLDHLLRELAGRRAPLAGLAVSPLPDRRGWTLRAVPEAA